jgi:hypothetical protein
MEANPSGGPQETISSSSPLANHRVPMQRWINLGLAHHPYPSWLLFIYGRIVGGVVSYKLNTTERYLETAPPYTNVACRTE